MGWAPNVQSMSRRSENTSNEAKIIMGTLNEIAYLSYWDFTNQTWQRGNQNRTNYCGYCEGSCFHNFFSVHLLFLYSRATVFFFWVPLAYIQPLHSKCWSIVRVPWWNFFSQLSMLSHHLLIMILQCLPFFNFYPVENLQ